MCAPSLLVLAAGAAPRDRSAGLRERGQLHFWGSTTSVLPKSVAPGLRFRRKRSRPREAVAVRPFSPGREPGRTHGASYPVAPLKWGPGPRRIALGKKLAPCEEDLHPDGAGLGL